MKRTFEGKRTPITFLCLSVGLASLAACSSSKSQSEAGPDTGVNTGLLALGSGDVDGELLSLPDDVRSTGTKEELIEQAALDLEKLIASGELGRSRPRNSEGTRASSGSRTGAEISPTDPSSSGLTALAGNALASGGQASQTPGTPAGDPPSDPFVLSQADEAWESLAPQPAPSTFSSPASASGVKDASQQATVPEEDRLTALASGLAAMLRETKADGQPWISEPVALSAIEAISAGSIAALDSPTSSLARRLSAEDLQTLIAARDRAAESPAASAQSVQDAIDAIAPPEFRIGRTALCKRVRRFGNFDAFPSNRFIAGQKHKAIVYVEVEGFGARPAQAGDKVPTGAQLSEHVSVELEQSISLFQDSDGFVSFATPAQRVVETSLSKRRDFYLIQIIDLPQALAIGKYTLKVSLKDVTTNAVAEQSIPIEIFAP